VEDEDSVRDLTERMLRSAGHRVISASTGSEALTLLDSHADIDVLVTDVVLPGGMNGADVARAVRRAIPGAKVLFVSGYPRDVSLDLEDEESVSYYLEKPFTAEALLAKVQEILSSRD